MTRLISVTDSVYAELSKLKGEKSFSKLLSALLHTHSQSNKEAVLNLVGKIDLIDERKIKSLGSDWSKWSGKYA